MIKVIGSDIEIDGNVDVVFAELMSANVEVAELVSEKELELNKITKDKVIDRKIEILESVLNGCILYIKDLEKQKGDKND